MQIQHGLSDIGATIDSKRHRPRATLIRFFHLVTGLVNRLADGAGTRAPEFDIYTLCLTDEAEDGIGVSLIICPLPNGELGW
jgi:hypothetical protein